LKLLVITQGAWAEEGEEGRKRRSERAARVEGGGKVRGQAGANVSVPDWSMRLTRQIGSVKREWGQDGTSFKIGGQDSPAHQDISGIFRTRYTLSNIRGYFFL
jgi:hypothetical protein